MKSMNDLRRINVAFGFILYRENFYLIHILKISIYSMIDLRYDD